ncbi:lisH domain-containing protein ARMC9-like isoform X3 [Diachasmimorpha longicaudata]|uniref:lisH domain-containing protein ARMC9-like isoform X3 n=1 Tax=Diachasmimorpha longicaudata TaxID=58733 RepID=UPI0030B913CC
MSESQFNNKLTEEITTEITEVEEIESPSSASNCERSFPPEVPGISSTMNPKFDSLTSNDRDIPDFLANERKIEAHRYLVSKSTQTQWKDQGGDLLTSELTSPTTPRAKKPLQAPPNRHSQELMLTRSQLSNVHRKYQQLKIRFHRLHTDYYKLMSITGELTSSLSSSIHHEPVSIEATLKNCMRIYPDLFDKNIRDSKISLCDSDNYERNGNKSVLVTVPLLPKQLNYRKIKFHLISGNVRVKLLLLQALRWKITLSQPDERDEIVNEFINSDLLGLHGQIAGDSGRAILPYLLVPLDVVQPHPVQQSAARLLNTFASLKCGRDYLAMGPTVLNVVVQCLDSTQADSIDAFTCDMIIAMLQKLSLRRHQRLYMIASGLVEWLIHHLKAECHSMGSYRLEYATALLMNLSLHKEAQIRAAAIATMVMSTLIALLSTEHLPALPYINGALNSFLANSSINEEAKLMGLGPILEYHRKHRTGELRKHLEYILMRHRRQPNETIEELLNDDDDREEFDVLEDELDEMDPVKVNIGDLFGDTLLSSCYSLATDLPPDSLDVLQAKSPTVVQRISESILSELKDREDDVEDETINRKNLSSRLTPQTHKPKYPNPVKLLTLGNPSENSLPSIRLLENQENLSADSRLSVLIFSPSQTSITKLDRSNYTISCSKGGGN